MTAPAVEYSKEIRFAVVMYGGVSLAVYMNGIAQELFHLVRATAPDEISPNNAPRWARYSDSELTPTERIYRKAAMSGPAGCDSAGTGALRTRFVIDVVSGTSAGGINGLFLGKALALGKNGIGELTDLWLDEADFGLLLNDKQSVRGERNLTLQDPPRSLLNSQRMYLKLLNAIRAMQTSGDDGRGGLVDELDVYLTATDMDGVPTHLQLFDEIAQERRHRHVFRFKPEDLKGKHDPLLAFAARCTSSFPVAFQPMRLVDIDPVVERVYGGNPDLASLKSSSPEWTRFLPNYTDGFTAERPFTDGGFLDNKPFSYAVSTLLEREADTVVDRKLLYIEPDVEEIHKTIPNEEAPDFIKTTLKGLTALPLYETIREDLQAIIGRNRQIERLEDAVQTMEDSVDLQVELPTSAWANQGRDSTNQYGPGYAGTHRLKVSCVTDDLARLLAGLAGLDPESEEVFAIRNLIRRWREKNYHYGEQGPDKSTLNRFLMDFDFDYRVRRLKFVLRKVDKRMSDPQLPPERCEQFRNIRRGLSRCLMQLVTKRREYSPSSTTQTETKRKIQEIIRDLNVDADRLRTWLSDKIPPKDLEEKGIEEIARELSADFRATCESVSAAVMEVLFPYGPPTEEQLNIQPYYRHFELYDSVMFPILYGTEVGEADPVEVVRISSRDSTSLFDEQATGCKKLSGATLHHFGALFKRSWRESDILWGRLDAAERLLKIVAPGPSGLLEEAQAAIIDEVLETKTTAEKCEVLCCVALRTSNGRPDSRVLKSFYEAVEKLPCTTALPTLQEVRSHYGVHFHNMSQMDPEPTARQLARATTIIGKMIEEVSNDYPLLNKPGIWIVRCGRTLWGVVELAMPRSLPNILLRHWLTVCYLAGALLFFVGMGNNDILAVAQRLLAVTLVADGITQIVRQILASQNRIAVWIQSGIKLLLAAAIALVATADLSRIQRYAAMVGEFTTADLRQFTVDAPGWLVYAVPALLFVCGLLALKIHRVQKQFVSIASKPAPGPMLQLYLCSNVARFNSILGPPGVREANKTVVRRSLYWDYVLIPFYVGSLFALNAALGWSGGWTLVPMALSTAMIVAAAVSDVLENLHAYRMLDPAADNAPPGWLKKQLSRIYTPATTAEVRIQRLTRCAKLKWGGFFGSTAVFAVSLAFRESVNPQGSTIALAAACGLLLSSAGPLLNRLRGPRIFFGMRYAALCLVVITLIFSWLAADRLGVLAALR